MNFNISKQGEIALLFRYNQNYHMGLKDFIISNINKTSNFEKYQSNYKQTQFKFIINIDALYNQINIYYSLEKTSKNSVVYTKFDSE